MRATEAWPRELAATAGLALPRQVVEHMDVVTEPMAGVQAFMRKPLRLARARETE